MNIELFSNGTISISSISGIFLFLHYLINSCLNRNPENLITYKTAPVLEVANDVVSKFYISWVDISFGLSRLLPWGVAIGLYS